MFVPLSFEAPLESQLLHVDTVLHKATDEIISVEFNDSSEYLKSISYTRGMQEFFSYVEENYPSCFIIDPVDKISIVLDRLRIQEILQGLVELKEEGCLTIRGPRFLKVNDFNQLNLIERLRERKLFFPCIVKPQVACGISKAHNMAIIFGDEELDDNLEVSLPAIIQEYVDHSSTLFKIYVLGDHVFHVVKKSLPNADVLMELAKRSGLQPLIFDSLKPLPIAVQQAIDGNSLNGSGFDFKLVMVASKWLARKLDLTIFGFDVVVQDDTNDHVIVDINYFPSFKDVPDDVAIPAFWDAILKKFVS